MPHLWAMLIPRKHSRLLMAASLAWSAAHAALPTETSATPAGSTTLASSPASPDPVDQAAMASRAAATDSKATGTNSLAIADGSSTAPTSGTNGNPFSAIPARNIFQIKPPPPPPDPVAEVPKPPTTTPPNVFLTGFSSWKGVKKVYLQVNRPGSKAPDYLDLRVGDLQGEIKILDINDHEETAKILNGDQEILLSFRENGLKANASPVPGVQGVPNPANPGGAPPRPPGQTTAGSGPAYIGKGGIAQNAGAVPPPNGGAIIQPWDASVADMRTLPAPRTRATSTASDAGAATPVFTPNQPRPSVNGRTPPPPPSLPIDVPPPGS